jgi:hypothetical protein
MDLRRPLLIALLLVPALAGHAAAQPQPVSDANRATARALAAEAHAAFDKKDYVTAADRFARADALVHAPTLLLGLAQSKIALGKWVEAQEILNRILREGVAPGSPPAFSRALGEAKKELDALTPRMPFVIVEVTGPSADAVKVSIGGVDLPAAVIGVKRPIDPGKHQVRAGAEGFTPVEEAVTAAEGKTVTVTLQLKADPNAPAPPPVTPSPEEKPSSLRFKLGIAGVAVGGAGIVLGAVAGGIALAKHGELAKKCPPPSGNCDGSVTQGDLDSFRGVANGATAGFVLGAALAATGIVLMVTAPKAKPAAGAWITPLVGPGALGLQGGF